MKSKRVRPPGRRLGVCRGAPYDPKSVALPQTQRRAGIPRSLTYLDFASGALRRNRANLMFAARTRARNGFPNRLLLAAEVSQSVVMLMRP